MWNYVKNWSRLENSKLALYLWGFILSALKNRHRNTALTMFRECCTEICNYIPFCLNFWTSVNKDKHLLTIISAGNDKIHRIQGGKQLSCCQTVAFVHKIKIHLKSIAELYVTAEIRLYKENIYLKGPHTHCSLNRAINVISWFLAWHRFLIPRAGSLGDARVRTAYRGPF